MESGNIFVALSHALFAMFAALVKFLNLKDKRRRTLAILLGEMAASLFISIAVFLFCFLYNGMDAAMSILIAGGLGLGGMKVVDKIHVAVDRKTLGKHDDTKD